MVENLVYSKFNFRTVLYDYNIELKSRLTLVTNESGFGKTLLYKALQDYAVLYRCANIYFYNYTMPKEESAKFLFKENTLVVIDNASIMIDNLEALHIALNVKTQYLIFTHTADVYKYKPTFRNIAVLKKDKNGEVVTLKYMG